MKRIILFLILTVAFVACEKTLLDENQQWQYADTNAANLKIVNAYTSNVPAGAPGVGVTRFYAYREAQKLNGNALTAPGAWPGPATYASVPTGKANYFLILDRRVGNDYGKAVKGDTAFKGNFDFAAGKFYTMFMIDQSPNQSLMIIEDDYIPASDKKYRVRFANLVPDPARPIDIYSRKEKKKIATGVNYKQISQFLELSIPTSGDTLDVFDATSSTKALYSFNNFVPVSKRVYTFYAQGRRGFRTEALSNYINR